LLDKGLIPCMIERLQIKTIVTSQVETDISQGLRPADIFCLILDIPDPRNGSRESY